MLDSHFLRLIQILLVLERLIGIELIETLFEFLPHGSDDLVGVVNDRVVFLVQMVRNEFVLFILRAFVLEVHHLEGELEMITIRCLHVENHIDHIFGRRIGSR